LAQNLDPSQAPPSIEFNPPVLIRQDDVARELRLDFPSAFSSGVSNNDQARLHIYLPADVNEAIPAVIVLHYLGADNLSVETRFAAQLNRRRIAAIILELPYHLSRTPAGFASGSQAIRPDTDHLKRTMVQSVLDVRRTVDWITTRSEFDPKRIGIMGTSLGGIVATLSAAVEPRFSAQAFVLAGADLAHILWHSSRVVTQRETMRRAGYTEDRLRAELQDIEPLRFLPSAPKRPSLVITAKFDTVVPPRASQLLIQALDQPEVATLNTGHFGGVFAGSSIISRVGEFFQRQFYGTQRSRLAKQLAAPTIRLGAIYDGQDGLQVAAGADIWKFTPKGDVFLAGLLSPRGGRLYLGLQVSRGLSVGVIGTTRKVTWGTFWNAVL